MTNTIEVLPAVIPNHTKRHNHALFSGITQGRTLRPPTENAASIRNTLVLESVHKGFGLVVCQRR